MNDFLKQCLFSGAERFFCGGEPDGQKISGDVRLEQHPAEEFLFVLDGSSVFACADREYRAVPGDFFRIAPWLPHQFGYRPADGGLLHLWGSCAPGGTGGWNLLQVTSGGAWSTIECGKYPAGIWQYARKLADAGERESDPEIRRRWHRLGSDLLLANMLLPEEKNGEKKGLSRAGQLTELVKRQIDATLGKACSLEQLAALAGYCPSHISHTFKQTAGESIGAYIDRVRRAYLADAAAYGLRQKEIAAALGFSSAAAFRQWKKRNF